MHLCRGGNRFATDPRLYRQPDKVGLQAMSTATEHLDGQPVKPVKRDSQRELYDPHFPLRSRAKVISDRTRNENFDPHFPPRPQL